MMTLTCSSEDPTLWLVKKLSNFLRQTATDHFSERAQLPRLKVEASLVDIGEVALVEGPCNVFKSDESCLQGLAVLFDSVL